MTTWTDMIQKLDNPRYVGKVNRPVKRVNKVYKLYVGGQLIHTEYHTVDRIAMERMHWHYDRQVEKVKRYGMDEESERFYLADPFVEITDRDGKVTKVTLG